MQYRVTFLAAIALFAGTVIATDALTAYDSEPLYAARSTLTVFVYKSGLFSAFADNHVIRAPIAKGSIVEEAPAAVEILVHSADLQVTDPGVDAGKRSEVQTRMLGPEVLDVAKFPDITFTSTS